MSDPFNAAFWFPLVQCPKKVEEVALDKRQEREQDKEEKGSNTGNKHLGKVKCYRCHQMGRYVN